MGKKKYILLTIDVEDWFQVENFRPWIPFETWGQQELRVERNVHRLLNLFDSVASAGRLEARGREANMLESYEAGKPESSGDFENSSIHSGPVKFRQNNEAVKKGPSSLTASQLRAKRDELKNDGQHTTDDGHTKKVQATFFVLGWIADRLPHLIREIQSRGHEVASHGYNHNLCNRQLHSDLKKELTDSKKLLADITGSSVHGFRAPNFSISEDTLKIAEGCGYLYDSSYNSFGLNSRYGRISLSGHRKKGIAHQFSENFFELPISNLNIGYKLSAASLKRNHRNRFVLPWGGGAYFRLIPYSFFKHGVQSILKRDEAYAFYIHPWELDAEQPRVKAVSYRYKFRHYTNLGKTNSKLTSLLNSFQSCRFITCSQYLSEIE